MSKRTGLITVVLVLAGAAVAWSGGRWLWHALLRLHGHH